MFHKWLVYTNTWIAMFYLAFQCVSSRFLSGCWPIRTCGKFAYANCFFILVIDYRRLPVVEGENPNYRFFRAGFSFTRNIARTVRHTPCYPCLRNRGLLFSFYRNVPIR